MRYKRFENVYIVRLEKGEELVACLKRLAADEKIALANISGLGAADRVQVGLFDPNTKEYHADELKDDFEIVSLSGTISTMKDEPYLHCHITVADRQHRCFGGHLNYANISATAELVIEVIDGKIDRELDEAIGLNLIKFD